MLEELDKVNWSQLEHGYGEAARIPQEIRNLISNDSEVRDRARRFLFGSSYDDLGRSYQATPFIVQYVLEIIENDDAPERDVLIEMLQWVAGVAVPQGEMSYRSVREAEVRIYSYRAIEKGVNVFLRLLEDTDPKIRKQTAELLRYLRDSSKQLIPILSLLVNKETEEQVQLEIVKSLEVLLLHTEKSCYPQYIEILLNIVIGQFAFLVRVQAAHAAVHLLYEQTSCVRYKEDNHGFPPQVEQILIESFMNEHNNDQSRMRYSRMSEAILSLRILGSKSLITLLEMPNLAVDYAHYIVERLISNVFQLHSAYWNVWQLTPAHHTLRKPGFFYCFSTERVRNPDLLTSRQIEAIKAIVDCDIFWTVPTNMLSLFCFLPDFREELRALIEKT